MGSLVIEQETTYNFNTLDEFYELVGVHFKGTPIQFLFIEKILNHKIDNIDTVLITFDTYHRYSNVNYLGAFYEITIDYPTLSDATDETYILDTLSCEFSKYTLDVVLTVPLTLDGLEEL